MLHPYSAVYKNGQQCCLFRCRSSQSKVDYESVLLVTRYLASNRPFSQSFDIYLTQVMIATVHLLCLDNYCLAFVLTVLYMGHCCLLKGYMAQRSGSVKVYPSAWVQIVWVNGVTKAFIMYILSEYCISFLEVLNLLFLLDIAIFFGL